MELSHDYTAQAGRYDTTRGVSPEILDPAVEALRAAPGSRLLDVGGGTGNYAAALSAEGFAVTVVDSSPAMLEQARAKGLAVLEAHAVALPLPDGCCDAVAMLSMLHQVEDWRSALAEARRVLAPHGVLALTILAADQVRAVAWVFDLFPTMGALALRGRPTLAEIAAELPGSRRLAVLLDGLDDGSIAALCRHPEAILDPSYRNQTSFFEKLEAANPAELEAGLATLARWLHEGRRPDHERDGARRHLGDLALLVWVKPGA